MIDRGREPRRQRFIPAFQKAGRLKFAIEGHRKIDRDHGANVPGTATMTRRLFRTGRGLRHVQRTRRLAQVSHRIRHHIAREKQHGQKRKNAQKSGPMQRRHRSKGYGRVCRKSMRMPAQKLRSWAQIFSSLGM
jgi:hypothetical protein